MATSSKTTRVDSQCFLCDSRQRHFNVHSYKDGVIVGKISSLIVVDRRTVLNYVSSKNAGMCRPCHEHLNRAFEFVEKLKQKVVGGDTSSMEYQKKVDPHCFSCVWRQRHFSVYSYKGGVIVDKVSSLTTIERCTVLNYVSIKNAGMCRPCNEHLNRACEFVEKLKQKVVAERATPVQISMEPAAESDTSVEQVHCIVEVNEDVEEQLDSKPVEGVVVMSPLDYLRWSSSRDDSESNNQTVKEIGSQISSNKYFPSVKSEDQFDLQGYWVKDINTSGSVPSRHENDSSEVINQEDEATHLTVDNTLVEPNMAQLGEKSVQTLASDFLNNQNGDLIKRKRKHTDEKKFTCDMCSFASSYKNAIAKHMMIHTGEKPYQCDICEYASNSNYSLVRHKRTHSEGKLYHCNICDFACNQRPDLYKHMRRHTGEKPYKCSVCEFSTSWKHCLVVHTRRHTGETPYMCDVCDYKCYRSDVLTTHKIIHTEEGQSKLYKCEFCEFTSQMKSHFNTHMRTHKEDKKYKCDFCEYSSDQNCALIVHLRIHTGEKPYLCDVCEYASKTRGCLNKHMLTHSAEKPYVCDICNHACKQKSNLDNHIMRKHKGQELCKHEVSGHIDKV